VFTLPFAEVGGVNPQPFRRARPSPDALRMRLCFVRARVKRFPQPAITSVTEDDMTCRRIARSVRVWLGLGCIGALLAPSLAWAGVEPQPFRTGLFGITPGQAIRVSVLNADDGGVINPCVNPGALVAAVLIRNVHGGVLFKVRSERVPAGMGTFVDFIPPPEDGRPQAPGVLPRAAKRVQVRAEVYIALGPIPDDGLPVPEDGQPPPEDGQPIPEDGTPGLRRAISCAMPTLEVFDVATGRTEFTMPFAEVGGVNPQPF
jgi:hypothetical protein